MDNEKKIQQIRNFADNPNWFDITHWDSGKIAWFVDADGDDDYWYVYDDADIELRTVIETEEPVTTTTTVRRTLDGDVV